LGYRRALLALGSKRVKKLLVITSGLLSGLMLAACGGGSGASLTISLSPQSVMASFEAGTAYTFSETATIQGLAPADYDVVAVDQTGTIQNVTIEQQTNNSYVATVNTMSNLPVGEHKGLIQVSLCSDEACSQLYASTSLPIDFTVTPACHNLPLANGLFGQKTYAGDSSNQGLAEPTAATLAAPTGGLVTNAAGTIGYVADKGNNRVLGFMLPQSAGQASASFVLGQSDLVSNVSGTGARSGSPFGLSAPNKVSVSDDGRLVVADTFNNRVLIWNTLPTSNVAPDIILGQASLGANQSNLGASNPSATSLSNPTAAMLGNNKLVVVDQNNNRVLIWNAAVGTLTTGSAASVELGQVDNGNGSGFTTNTPGYFYTNQTTGAQSVQFDTPTDVWTDGLSLVISDTGNNRVLYWNQVPTANFTNATEVIGQTHFSTTNPGVSSQLVNSPNGVFVASGMLFVADTGNNRVLEFDNGWTTQNDYSATGVYGQQDFTHSAYNDDDQNGIAGDQQNAQSNTNATQNTLHSPNGVFAIDGNIYVSDDANNRVVEYPVNSAVDGTNTGVCNGYQPLAPN